MEPAGLFRPLEHAGGTRSSADGRGTRNRTEIVLAPKASAIPLGDTPSGASVGYRARLAGLKDRISSTKDFGGKLVGLEGLEPSRPG